MPGSWERSCLTARSIVRFSRTLPSLPLRRVFCCPPRGSTEHPGQVPKPRARATMVNVASYQHGVGHGARTRVNGFSEAVVAWIAASETALN